MIANILITLVVFALVYGGYKLYMKKNTKQYPRQTGGEIIPPTEPKDGTPDKPEKV